MMNSLFWEEGKEKSMIERIPGFGMAPEATRFKKPATAL
jgi:hypothetical protein